jgi:shikimate dehydrogenase
MSNRYLLGLIGNNIQSSISPALHEDALRAAKLAGHYRLVDPALRGENLRSAFDAAKSAGLSGFNVTVPYKEEIIALLDELSSEARKIGAVNTVTLDPGGRTTGYNTDSTGFLRGFEESIGRKAADGKTAVLVGAGGAGRAVAFALLDLGTAMLLVHDKEQSRASQLVSDLVKNYGKRATELVELDERVAVADGIVNATPVGMQGIPGRPVPDAVIGRQSWIADVIYSPIETEFLKSARAKGIAGMDGGGMCVHQAAEAFRLFTGVVPDIQRMRRVFDGSIAAREK